MNLFQIDITGALTNLKQRAKIENLPENIQDEFLLKLLLTYYYRNSNNLEVIPERHRTVEMCVDYFLRARDISLIPENKRDKVFNEILSKTNNLSLIPIEYRTKKCMSIGFIKHMILL